MDKFGHILAKSEKNGKVPLTRHLEQVALVAETVARNIGLDPALARKGAILHDIGKVNPYFQASLCPGFERKHLFRHEIASLFFLSLLEEKEKGPVIDMVAAHHKSIYKDARGYGILDLDDQVRNCFELHAGDFETWSKDALAILEYFGFPARPVTWEQARNSYEEAIEYCSRKKYGYSRWKGVLTAADHLASATEHWLNDDSPGKLFVKPDLSYYDSRRNEYYPLSLLSTSDSRRHTLVNAPTGAGKTDFLLRRCRGRVFYVLPFQASINAMYERIKKDLKNTDADIRMLHASSGICLKEGKLEEKILQRHAGASVKVLTPHQLAALVFGTKGYEALAVDLEGCDVVLDEIHTYSDTIQAIVLKIVQILIQLDCRVHIGTATMPSYLYARLLSDLGGPGSVYEVTLPGTVLDSFDRHTVHKSVSLGTLYEVLDQAIENKQKTLVVCNRVQQAQKVYTELVKRYPKVPAMLIHSRFRRRDRIRLEACLKEEYNGSANACLVVSTQVVEVSLDISFDLMITDCAPIDALVQRFGRINRVRTAGTIGKQKPVYVLQPPAGEKEALPYSREVLERTFEALEDGKVLKERQLQQLIDQVYSTPCLTDLDRLSVFAEGKWRIKELWHHPKSALLEALDIDSVTCITEDEADVYESSPYEIQAGMEIPVSFRSIGYRRLEKLNCGSAPFVIPRKAYDPGLGFLADFAKPELYEITYCCL